MSEPALQLMLLLALVVGCLVVGAAVAALVLIGLRCLWRPVQRHRERRRASAREQQRVAAQVDASVDFLQRRLIETQAAMRRAAVKR